MTTFMQYKNLIEVLIRNSFRIDKLLKVKSSTGKIFALIGIGLALLSFLAFVVFQMVVMTLILGSQGLLPELIYLILFASQLVVLFFGGISIMNYLFFSKDNQMLKSLPIDPKAIFMAKFSMAYIAELLFSTLILVPTLTTIGVVSMIYGFGLPWYFFLVEILAIFFVPIIPLLVATLISMPLMYVVSFFKRKAVGNGIALAILYILVLGVYFLFVGSTAGFDGNIEEVVISPALINAMIGIKKATIFNYPLVQTFLGIRPLLNVLIYVLGLIVVLGITILLSGFFYNKALATLVDGTGSSNTKKKDTIVESSSIMRSFLYKEIKTLTHTPVLMMSLLLGIVLTPAMVFFMSFTMSSTGSLMPGEGEFFLVGMITYLSYLLVSSTNQIGIIGFSREGKNLFVLKSLPISPKLMVDAKLLFASMITVISSILVGIAFPIATKTTSPSAIIGLPLLLLLGGYGMNCMGLLNDLKNPNLKWNNVSELTKNNKRALKPMLVSLGVGFFYMFLGIGMGMVIDSQNIIKGELAYFIYFAICLIPVLIIAIVCHNKLYNSVDVLWDKIEG